jgi:tRNA A-37 threonylcarbamoyl transferase component Bud32
MSATSSSINLADDPLLPQRDLLLDVEEVAGRLASRLGTCGAVAIDSCERLRTKYRFGDSLRVLHRIRVGGSDFDIAARTFPEGRSKRVYERALGASVYGAPLRPVAHDADIETVFWTFPNDRRVAGLRALTNVPAELAHLFPAWTRSRVIAYAPEKCATAQCLDDESNVLAYAKVYQGEEGRRVFDVYENLGRSLSPDATELRLPRALAYDEAHRMLLLESVEGERIADLGGPDVLRVYRRLGAALATLHKLPPPQGLPTFERLSVTRVRHAARIIGRVRPDVRSEAHALADQLAARWEPTGHPPVCLHGDVHPKNGILRGGRLTLIDLDQAASGSSAADLGSLLASLSYNCRCGILTRAAAQELGDAFLDGYAGVRELPLKGSLRWHTAAALLAERALRAVNRIRPEGLMYLRELLAGADNILRVGGMG